MFDLPVSFIARFSCSGRRFILFGACINTFDNLDKYILEFGKSTQFENWDTYSVSFIARFSCSGWCFILVVACIKTFCNFNNFFWICKNTFYNLNKYSEFYCENFLQRPANTSFWLTLVWIRLPILTNTFWNWEKIQSTLRTHTE